MQKLATVGEWVLFECSDSEEMLRVAYDGYSWYHVCDSATAGWDPDPMVPQSIINIHFSLTPAPR